MTAPDDARRRADELIEQLRTRVQERREAGQYPQGLEADLDAHFQRIISQRPGDLESVRSSLVYLEGTMGFDAARIHTASDLRGGDLVHRAIAKAVSRQTQGVLEQVRTFAEAVRDTFQALISAMEFPTTHVHADLMEQVDTVLERIAAFERIDSGAPVEIEVLRRRIEELEAIEARREFHPWFSNQRFEEAFRGTAEELQWQYEDLAREFVAEGGPVIDIGCGRGEFLELLRDLDVDAFGVELDPELVRATTDRGLVVEHGDGLVRLAAETDGSLGGIVLIQVVEHLTAQQVTDLVQLAAEKLRPGGRILIETVNPQSLYVFAHSLYVDPTHAKPVHPAYLDFLFREAGFDEIGLRWRSLPDPEESLDELPDEGKEAENENVRRLNRLVFGPQDYALIAIR